MERREVIDLMREINLYYGTRGKTQDDILREINDWESPLRDLDATVVFDNLKKHIQRSDFPPKLADLVKRPQEEQPRTIRNAAETAEMLNQYKKDPEVNEVDVERELQKLRKIVGLDE